MILVSSPAFSSCPVVATNRPAGQNRSNVFCAMILSMRRLWKRTLQRTTGVQRIVANLWISQALGVASPKFFC
jgi:hypothetical protein